MMKLRLVKISAIFCAAVMILPCATKATPVGTVDIALSGFGAHDLMEVWAAGYEGISGYGGVNMLDKTYGALQIAYGITGDWSKIVVIDTENHSADLYAHLGNFNVIGLGVRIEIGYHYYTYYNFHHLNHLFLLNQLI